MRAPRLSLPLLLAIALGVGSNSSVYGFLQGLTQPAFSSGGSERIVSIFSHDRFREAGPFSVHDYQLLKSVPGSFEWIGAARINPSHIVIGDHTAVVTLAAATPNLAAALKIPFDDGVVISHRFWKSDFSGGENAVGSLVRIDDVEYKVSGIAPERLDGLYSDRSVDLWMPLHERDLQGESRGTQEVWVLARLGQGTAASQAQTEIRSRSASLREIRVTPFTGIAPNMARGLSRIGMFLNFSAAAVFFIACITVASLLLGRALRRSHETSLRIALGATRAELLSELFSDSVVISVTGGAFGLLLAVLTARALPSFLFAEDAERLSFAPHALPILGASLACIAVTVLCGMLPILGTKTDRPWMILQREAGSPSKAIQRLRSGLVVAQITACCMLVIATALLLDGLRSAFRTNAGHRLGDPVLVTVQAQTRRDGPEIDANYFKQVEQKAKSVAGMSPLAWTARLPGNGPTWRTFRLQPSLSQYRDVTMDIAWLTSESLKLLDGPPLAGRLFAEGDQGHRVAIIDEEAAAELYGRQTVGLIIRDHTDAPIEIIGVVKRKSDEAPKERRPTIYYGYLNRSDAPAPIQGAKFRIPVEPSTAGIELNANTVSATYFAALDLPLITGQMFSERGTAGQGRVGVINQEAADLYFKGNALGAGVIDDSGVRTEIIGVVRSQVFGTFEQHAEPTIYFPMWQDCPARMTLMLKDAKWDSRVRADLQGKVEAVPGRSQAPVGINTLDRQLAQSSLAGLRIAALIGGASAGIALILSILGLLSAQSDAEHQRQHERAVRIALGAQRWRIVFMVLTNAARLALAGTVAGTFLSFMLLRLLIAGVAPVNSPSIQVWLIAPLLSAAVVTLASAFPARRASAVSPLRILRDS